MKITAIEIDDKVDQLLAVLDRDIQQLRQNISRLDELRSMVIKRDDDSLDKLLKSIQGEQDGYKENEQKRQLLREEIAVTLDCKPGEITLTRLETELSAAKKTEVAGRKITLQTLAGQLKREHLSTAMLLSNCSRLNSRLLAGIFKPGKTETVTYGSKGTTERQMNTAFINLQF